MTHFLLRNTGMLRAVFFVLCLLALLGNIDAASAQTGRGPYLLGPGDVVDISVFRQPDLAMQARVQSDSSILIPVVGKIFIGGLSEQDAALRIRDALTSGAVVIDASVILHVVQFASKQVAVLGFINNPGAYYLDRPSRISDILSKAGGATTDSADFLIFTDYNEETGETERHEIALDDLVGASESMRNPKVGDRDIIFLPRAPIYYIYGEVGAPGAYKLERGMTVEQALAKAGGVTEQGNRDKIRRRDQVGEKRELRKVGLAEIVNSNDVLYVGTSLF